MNILIDPLFKNWSLTTAGTGTATVTSGTLTASSIVGDVGYATSDHVASEGEVYIFTVDARVTSFDGSNPAPGMFIDHPSFPSGRNRVRFDSSQWKSYSLMFTVPQNHVKSTDFITFGAGVITDQGGTVEVRYPMVRLEKTAPMTQSVWARGLFQITSGGVLTVLNQSNIINSAWQPGGGVADSDLLLTVPGIPSNMNTPPYPRAFVSTNGTDTYIAKTASEITGGSNGQFNVKILDTALSIYIQDNPAATTLINVEVVY